jgi:Fe-Mn family superoxide dismutase
MTKIELPPLPWAHDALAPAISKETIDNHYGKHHRTYVEKTNALMDREYDSLEDVIHSSHKDPKLKTLFNNAAQVWNHDRYWESLSPNGGKPSDALQARIDKDLGGLDKAKDELVKRGVGHFASGWVWLVFDRGKLGVIDTHDADDALVHGIEPLLVLDVWEHAYYLDYQSGREKHLRAVVGEILNWNGANEKFARLNA